VLQARPLYDTERDAELFVQPTGWSRLLTAVKHHFNVALVSPRGSGKTTVLRQLQRYLRANDERAVYVDATQVEAVGQLVLAIERELAGRAGVLHELRDDLVSTAGALSGGPPGSTSLRVVQRLRELGEQPATTILIDCSHAAKAAHDLFGRLRDELWQMDHRWVVAIDESERSLLLAPPADAFFDQVVAIELSASGILELLRRRRESGLTDETIRRIAETATSPRSALQAARDALTSADDDDPLAAGMWRAQLAAQLGRPHSMAMAELEALGGASASDEEFLRRLGWTRARASQVLGELADAKLVAPVDEQTRGGGRPRRVFRPASPPPGIVPPSGATELPVGDL
jgi:energy-coupling factor transporter ATP-binding protein EcfA2